MQRAPAEQHALVAAALEELAGPALVLDAKLAVVLVTDGAAAP